MTRYRPSERTFRALIEHGEDTLFLADGETKILYASPSVERIFGRTPESMLGVSGLDFTDPDELPRHRETFTELLATPGSSAQLEARVRHADGHYLDMVFLVHNRLADPDVGALVLNGRDLSAQKQAMRKVAELEQQLRHLAENTRDIVAVYQVVPEHRLLFISPSVERILGYPTQVFYDEPQFHLQIIHPDDLARQEEIVRGPPETRLRPSTIRWRHADGRTIWIEQRVVPGYDDQGRLVQVQSISRDVTEKILLEEELRRASKLQAIGQLAGGIAHDFNNLMAVVRLSSGAVARTHGDDPKLLRELGQIDEAVTRGIGLVRQLLTFSRRDEAEDDVVDVGRAVGNLEEILRRLLPENISIELDLSGTRPWVKLSNAKLEQVVINLAVNARDAMPDGGGLLLRVSTDDRGVMLLVRDTGIGMDAEQLSRIFEPFYSTKEPGQGTGLGLAVVYGVVEHSGGRLETDSSPGQGTEIRVIWPRAAISPPAEPKPEPTPGHGARETILLVEDESPLRNLIAEVLSSAGFHVLAAADTDEALALGRDPDTAIDLLLTDIVMPGMGGRQLAQALRAVRDGLPVLYISGYPGEVSPSESATAVLPKPFTEEELTRAVRGSLDAGSSS